jgi:hypothetical protein
VWIKWRRAYLAIGVKKEPCRNLGNMCRMADFSLCRCKDRSHSGDS